MELGFPSQAANLGDGRFFGYLGQAFDGDVATMTPQLLQIAQWLDEQSDAQPTDELTDPLVARLAGLVLAEGFPAA